MPATFVDSSLWFAYFDRRSSEYAAASGWLDGFTGRIVTSSDVLDEVVTLTAVRLGHARAVQAGDLLQTPLEVDLIQVDEPIREAAWSLFQSRPDKGYSLTDCTSFVIMRKLGLKEAATFDAHFAQEGFRTVP